MATFAIGDIHGQLAPLLEVLTQLQPSAGDTVVFLGDYIDRGLDTRACVDAVLGFAADTPATVVCLLGNHEEWMLRAMRDPTHHSWLLGMDGLRTVRSYSPEAADEIAAAARQDRDGLYGGRVALPYERFFAAMPPDHRRFFESLARAHETPECLCTHAGVTPGVDDLARQGRALVWGAHGFPDDYAGARTIVYGHHNNADVGDDDWPRPRIVGATYGLDTISHGVLTAIELPGPTFYQSRRHHRRQRGD
jgi:serine/threonine protein phosphatase 1